MFMVNDKREDIIFKAFFKHNDTPYSAVAVLKRMDAFEPEMEVHDIFNFNILFLMVIGKQFLNFSGHL